MSWVFLGGAWLLIYMRISAWVGGLLYRRIGLVRALSLGTKNPFHNRVRLAERIQEMYTCLGRFAVV